MAVARDAGGCVHGSLGIEQRHDVRRPVAADGVFDGVIRIADMAGKEAARNANGKCSLGRPVFSSVRQF
jgi:hypothetical protein